MRQMARRETDTMDTFICSSWYFLRYTDPQPLGTVQQGADRLPMPVDSSAELSMQCCLLYAVFYQVLYDTGWLTWWNRSSAYWPGVWFTRTGPRCQIQGSVVTPDGIVALRRRHRRLFILFACHRKRTWNGATGRGRMPLLRRVWRLVEEYHHAGLPAGDERAVEPGRPGLTERNVHAAIKKVTEDIEKRFNCNTAISAIMELVNAVCVYARAWSILPIPAGPAQDPGAVVLLLAPFYLTEEASGPWPYRQHSPGVPCLTTRPPCRWNK